MNLDKAEFISGIWDSLGNHDLYPDLQCHILHIPIAMNRVYKLLYSVHVWLLYDITEQNYGIIRMIKC